MKRQNAAQLCSSSIACRTFRRGLSRIDAARLKSGASNGAA
jgi:hypothetical protein